VRLATDEVFVGRPRRLQLVTDAIHWQTERRAQRIASFLLVPNLIVMVPSIPG